MPLFFVTNSTCDWMYVTIELVDASTCASVTGSATGAVPPGAISFALTCTGTGSVGYAAADQSSRSCGFFVGATNQIAKCGGVQTAGEFGTGCCVAASTQFNIDITGLNSVEIL